MTEENQQRTQGMTILQLVKAFCDICISRDFELCHENDKGAKSCEEIGAEILEEAERRDERFVILLGALCHVKEMADSSSYPSSIAAYLRNVLPSCKGSHGASPKKDEEK